MTQSRRYEKNSASPASAGKVRASRTGRPIMVLLDLLGRRLALRLLWELSTAGRPMTFRDLQAAAETNPGVLNTRLKELRAAGIVEHGQEGYSLSPVGLTLSRHVLDLHGWAESWAEDRLAHSEFGR